MKKFLLLAMAFMITSCGFNDFDGKNGSVSFTIPAGQVQALAAHSFSARQGDNEVDSIQFKFLVQLLGSEGFYTRQIKDAKFIWYLENEKEGAYKLISGDLSFSFDSLPEDQTYEVMLDVFRKWPEEPNEISDLQPNCELLYSLEEKNVKLTKNADTQVTLKVKETDYNPVFDVTNTTIKYTHEVPDGRNSKTVIDQLKPGDKIYCPNGTLIIQPKDDTTTRNPKDIYIASVQNSHLLNAQLSIRSYDGSELSIIGKKASIQEMLKNYLSNTDATLVQEVYIELYAAFGNLKTMYGTIKLNTDTPDISNPDGQGFNTYRRPLNFAKKMINTSDYNTINRYCADISFNELGIYNLSELDTVVFILRTKNEESSPLYVGPTAAGSNDSKELSYMFKENFDGSDGNEFSVNQSIKYTTPSDGNEYLRFVIPCNFATGGENHLVLFFDKDDSTLDSYNIDCDISNKVFSADENVYVFKNWENKVATGENFGNSRFEMNLKLSAYKPDITLNQGDNVRITISGTLGYLSHDNNNIFSPVTNQSLTFRYELYDNAYYDETGSTGDSYYHPLSNTNGDPLEKTLTTGSVISEAFTFQSILPPHTEPNNPEFQNDFRFQCYIDANSVSPEDLKFDENGLLYIKDFGVDIQSNQGN